MECQKGVKEMKYLMYTYIEIDIQIWKADMEMIGKAYIYITYIMEWTRDEVEIQKQLIR